MLRRKYVTQKTFRVDSQIAEDLESLSEILERTQNDLVNIAIEELLIKNKEWFSQNILIDYCYDYFYNAYPVNKKIESKCIIDGKEIKTVIDISLEIFESNTILKYSVIKNDKEILDKEEMIFSDSINDEKRVKEVLRNLSRYIDRNSDTMKNYLEQKLNYK